MRFALLTLLLASSTAAAQTTATYRVTFESTWSQATHPTDFPGASAHYSGLVGATHAEGVRLWAPGELASPGLKRMAETGGKGTLLAEVEALVDAGDAGRELSGGPIGRSPGSVTYAFDVDDSHAYVTLVSMIAPSPDWFVGVDGLALRDENGWVAEISTPLYVYDAGTDSGASYTSANAATDPSEAIARIEESPFKVGDDVVPVGTFTFELVSGAVSSDDDAREFQLSHPAPNPAASSTTLTLSGTVAPVTLTVFDALGRQIDAPALSPGATVLRLDTSSWAPGVYTVRVSTGGKVATRRVVVQR